MLNRTRVALLIAATMAAPVGAAVPNYQDLLKSLGPSGVVKPILAASGSPTAAQEIDQLGKILAASSSNAEAVLDALAAEKSLEAATVRDRIAVGHGSSCRCPALGRRSGLATGGPEGSRLTGTRRYGTGRHDSAGGRRLRQDGKAVAADGGPG